MYKHTHKHTHMDLCIHSYPHTHTYVRSNRGHTKCSAYMSVYTYMYVCIYVYLYIYTHTHTHTHTHTRTHTHTHTGGTRSAVVRSAATSVQLVYHTLYGVDARYTSVTSAMDNHTLPAGQRRRGDTLLLIKPDGKCDAADALLPPAADSSGPLEYGARICHTYVYAKVCVRYIRVYIDALLPPPPHMYVCTCKYLHLYLSISTSTYMCVCVCVYVCMYVCI